MKYFTKLFFPLFLTAEAAFASQQLILVVADDFNTTEAVLTRYQNDGNGFEKVGGEVPVNIGRNGLAWGIGESGLSPRGDEPVKKEGDGRAPAGIFVVSKAFGYAAQIDSRMPYIQADKELICVDDSRSEDYNRILSRKESRDPKSFEWMRRDDDLYKIGLVIGHNRYARKWAGSCIFFHIQKSERSPTAGCTAMREEDLAAIMAWIDPAKEPKVVQIPKSYCQQAEKLYKGIDCPVK